MAFEALTNYLARRDLGAAAENSLSQASEYYTQAAQVVGQDPNRAKELAEAAANSATRAEQYAQRVDAVIGVVLPDFLAKLQLQGINIGDGGDISIEEAIEALKNALGVEPEIEKPEYKKEGPGPHDLTQKQLRAVRAWFRLTNDPSVTELSVREAVRVIYQDDPELDISTQKGLSKACNLASANFSETKAKLRNTFLDFQEEGDAKFPFTDEQISQLGVNEETAKMYKELSELPVTHGKTIGQVIDYFGQTSKSIKIRDKVEDMPPDMGTNLSQEELIVAAQTLQTKLTARFINLEEEDSLRLDALAKSVVEFKAPTEQIRSRVRSVLEQYLSLDSEGRISFLAGLEPQTQFVVVTICAYYPDTKSLEAFFAYL